MLKNPQVITGLFTIAGTIVGTSLTLSSKWVDHFKERRSVRKEALFHLLEIHFNISRLSYSLNKDVGSILEEIVTVLPSKISLEDLKRALPELIGEPLKEIQRQQLEVMIADIDASYNECVKRLAGINPLLAYRLKGLHQKITSSEKLVNSFFDGLLKQAGPPTMQDMAVVRPMKSLASVKIIKDTLESLEELIVEIAGSLGKTTKRRALITVYDNKTVASQEEEFQTFIIEYKKIIMAAYRDHGFPNE